MAVPTGVNVLTISEGVRFTPLGQAVRIKIIKYMVGQDGPFTLDVDPANDNANWIEARLGEQAASIAALRGE